MKKLYLITESFPYGLGEKTFILPELPELIKYYDVTIVSHAPEAVINDQANITALPPEVKVVNLEIKMQWYEKLKYYIVFFSNKDGLKEALDILKGKNNIIERLYQSIGFFGAAMKNFRLMRRANLLPKDEEAIYYTYWYTYYTYSLSRNRKLYPKYKLITRTHRADLYDDAYKGSRQPFKRIMDKNIDNIFFIAEQGKKYYLNRYHLTDNKKYVVSRLGTIRVADSPNVITTQSGTFRLVSCSFVVPLKRVGLIVEALGELTDQIEWIHFGAGSELDNLSKQAGRLLNGKDNITYRLMGFVSNQDILNYYSRNYVNCFISTSSSEGIPVSIQEAMSFGIPIIATAVGGVPELIGDNGILMEANPNKKEVAKAITKMLHMSVNEYEELRQNSYRLWSEMYNAEVNRERFVQMLAAL